MAVTFSTGDKDYIPKLNQMADEFAQTESYRNEVADIRAELVNIAGGLPMVVGDYGLGTDTNGKDLPSSQGQVSTGIYRDGDAANGYPVFGWAASILSMRYNAGRQGQIGLSHGGGAPRIAFRTQTSNDIWSGPYELFGEHNSKNCVNHGIGGETVDILSDDFYDLPDTSGLYAIEGGSLLNGPTSAGNFQILSMSKALTTSDKMNYGAWLAISRDALEAYIGNINDSRAEPDRQRIAELYHSRNTNFNEFGKSNAGRVIARGSATATTSARFEFHLTSKRAPISITANPSDFEVRTIAGTAIGTVTSIDLLQISSERIAIVEVIISGDTFIADQPLHLRNLNTNGLTVNF